MIAVILEVAMASCAFLLGLIAGFELAYGMAVKGRLKGVQRDSTESR